MCEGFGMIVTKEIQGFFCEPDSDGDCSHSTILERLGWKDNENQHTRNFVRIQCPDWHLKSFEFDEDSSLPGWAEESRDEIIALIKKTLRKAAPAYAEYQRVTAPAYAEYQRVKDTAEAEYQRVTAPAYAEYQRVTAPAYAEYQRVTAPAEAQMIERMSKISGYVPAQEQKS
jgi:hypothetical protein